MGCEFFECDNCNDCKCDFAICNFCNNTIFFCLDCIEENYYDIYNVFFYDENNDEYGNMNYKFICDECIKKDVNDLYKNIKNKELIKFKEEITNKKNEFLDSMKSKILIQIQQKQIQIKRLQNKLEEIKEV